MLNWLLGFSLLTGTYLDEVKFHDKKAESVVGAGRVSGNVLRVNLVKRKLSWYHQGLRSLLCTFLLACPCVDKDPQLSILAPGRFPLSISAPRVHAQEGLLPQLS